MGKIGFLGGWKEDSSLMLMYYQIFELCYFENKI
jgi:hypothetical protein